MMNYPLTLPQYPWWCVELYTLADRDQLFWAVERQVRALVYQLRHGEPPGLTKELLKQLLKTGLRVPAFSESQRVRLVHAAALVAEAFPVSPLAQFWPFEILRSVQECQAD